MSEDIHHWSDEALAALPEKYGFRQRGMNMTRLETFTDAAFAFAVTLLVISVDDVPRSYEEFILALKQIPVFVACFAQLMLFWWGHHVWSRRYGLEDGWSMVWSLALVATVLIYIFPLRVIFAAFFANATHEILPVPFELYSHQVGILFAVFGAGFTVLTGIIVMLFVTALRRRQSLNLNALEVLETRSDIIGWSVVMVTGAVSTLLATLLPGELSPLSGFVYWTLIISMPTFGMWVKKQRRNAKHVES